MQNREFRILMSYPQPYPYAVERAALLEGEDDDEGDGEYDDEDQMNMMMEKMMEKKLMMMMKNVQAIVAPSLPSPLRSPSPPATSPFPRQPT